MREKQYLRTTFSRRTEAVEASGMIRPLRIAEIRRAGRERVRLHRLPVDKVRAGLDYDGNVCGPRNCETETVCFHTEIGFKH